MNALIFGRRRQGKSTLALYLCLSQHQTVVVFDPNNQFAAFPSTQSIDDLRGWIAAGAPGRIKVYRPTPATIDQEFQALVETLWPHGNYALLIDEASCLQTSHSIHPELERMIRQAPRDGARRADGALLDVTIIQTLHRPADANSVCRALATDTFIFQTSLARDIDTIEKQFGPHVAERLSTLKRFECLHCYGDADGRERFAHWRNSRRWYVRTGSFNLGRGGKFDVGNSGVGGPDTPEEAGITDRDTGNGDAGDAGDGAGDAGADAGADAVAVI